MSDFPDRQIFRPVRGRRQMQATLNYSRQNASPNDHQRYNHLLVEMRFVVSAWFLRLPLSLNCLNITYYMITIKVKSRRCQDKWNETQNKKKKYLFLIFDDPRKPIQKTTFTFFNNDNKRIKTFLTFGGSVSLAYLKKRNFSLEIISLCSHKYLPASPWQRRAQLYQTRPYNFSFCLSQRGRSLRKGCTSF